MSGRIYKCIVCRGRGGAQEPYLVRAKGPRSAQKILARKFISAKLATAADVAELTAMGVTITYDTKEEQKPPVIS